MLDVKFFSMHFETGSFLNIYLYGKFYFLVSKFKININFLTSSGPTAKLSIY